MFSPTPGTITDTGYVAWSCAPARNSGLRGPGTFEITRFTGGRVRARSCIVVRAAGGAARGGGGGGGGGGGARRVGGAGAAPGGARGGPLLGAAQELVRAL